MISWCRLAAKQTQRWVNVHRFMSIQAGKLQQSQSPYCNAEALRTPHEHVQTETGSHLVLSLSYRACKGWRINSLVRKLAYVQFWVSASISLCNWPYGIDSSRQNGSQIFRFSNKIQLWYFSTFTRVQVYTMFVFLMEVRLQTCLHNKVE